MPTFEDILSHERFGTYLRWADGDRDRAIALYTLNTQLSESLYTSVQMLEIAFRNRINDIMRKAKGDDWYNSTLCLTNPRQVEMLAKAKQDLTDARKAPAPGNIVAALTFGFWTALVGSGYEDLWQSTLHKIARKQNGKGLQRKDFALPLAKIRRLRNRIAHHEPILEWNLREHHDKIIELTGWLSPSAAEWSLRHCRFASIFPANGVELCRPGMG